MSDGTKTKRTPWPVICRGLLVLIPALLCIAIQKVGWWMDNKGNAGFDRLMDWAHGNKDWRYR